MSNLLTFFLPALYEAAKILPLCDCHGNSHSDRERLGRQLSLASQRLSLLFTELRRGGQPLLEGSKTKLDPYEIVCEALAKESAPPTFAVTPPPMNLYIKGDPMLLQEAFSRLIRAACGWARTAQLPKEPIPPLPLRLSSLGGDWVLSIVLPQSRRVTPAQLVEMLCPAENGETRAERGFLGILLANEIVRLHGGRIFATIAEDTNGEGMGLALVCHLPLCESSNLD